MAASDDDRQHSSTAVLPSSSRYIDYQLQAGVHKNTAVKPVQQQQQRCRNDPPLFCDVPTAARHFQVWSALLGPKQVRSWPAGSHNEFAISTPLPKRLRQHQRCYYWLPHLYLACRARERFSPKKLLLHTRLMAFDRTTRQQGHGTRAEARGQHNKTQHIIASRRAHEHCFCFHSANAMYVTPFKG